MNGFFFYHLGNINQARSIFFEIKNLLFPVKLMHNFWQMGLMLPDKGSYSHVNMGKLIS